MTTIPCKRPQVRLNELLGRDRVAAVCDVPGCGWHYDNVVKTDVQQQATRHRQEHRAVVPETEILRFDSGVYQASCSCGWYRESPGVPTRADNQAALDYHLSHDHGLVTCP